jgi:hypothetical protein
MNQPTPYVLEVPEKLVTGINAENSIHPPYCPGMPFEPGAIAPPDWNEAEFPGKSDPLPNNAALSRILIALPWLPPSIVNEPP